MSALAKLTMAAGLNVVAETEHLEKVITPKASRFIHVRWSKV